MSQSSLTIGNVNAAPARTALNGALAALATLASGETAPSTTFAHMWWFDTSTDILKMRSSADDAWISVAYLDQTANAFRIMDDTQVVNTSGTQTGLLGDQATATWEAGTGTTPSLISPAQAKAAIDALGGAATAGPIATTSGTAIDFASIPAGVSQVEIGFNGVSLSGTDNLLVQAAVAATPVTSGYVSATHFISGAGQGSASSTAGFIVAAGLAASVLRGSMTLRRVPEVNTWVSDHTGTLAANIGAWGGGSITLAGALTGLRITRTGTDTFDAGSVFLRYR